MQMNQDLFQDLLFIINVVLPVFLLVFVGIVLRLIKIVDEQFVRITSNFVYKVSLPALIFLKLYDVDLERTINVDLMLLIILGTIAVYYVAKIIAKYMKLKPEDEGVYIQGAFRSNYAIVGLAIILRMFGLDAVAKASFLLLFALPIYNLYGVVALTLPHNQSSKINYVNLTKEIMLNPLILSVIAAIPFSIFKIGIPSSIETTGNYLADIALPLALISIGGSMNVQSIKNASGLAFGSSVIKNIIAPLIVIIPAYFLNIRGEDLGILFIVFACPTAIASFIMAAGMKGNVKLAGNIVIISTLGSLLTMTLGLFILRMLELI